MCTACPSKTQSPLPVPALVSLGALCKQRPFSKSLSSRSGSHQSVSPVTRNSNTSIATGSPQHTSTSEMEPRAEQTVGNRRIKRKVKPTVFGTVKSGDPRSFVLCFLWRTLTTPLFPECMYSFFEHMNTHPISEGIFSPRSF